MHMQENNKKRSISFFTKINIAIIIIIICLFFVFFLNKNDSTQYKQTSVDNINLLWEETVSLALRDKLWLDKYSYDATSYLLMPLEYAYKVEDEEKINEFRVFFEEFFEENYFNSFENDNRLTRIQFLFFASEFLKKDIQFDEEMDNSLKYVNLISNSLEALWLNTPAWQWEHENFNGMKHRMDWKIMNKSVKQSYYRAFIDEELFLLSTASNIKYVERYLDIKIDNSEILDDIINYADYIFMNEIRTFEDGRWLLQPGVWKDLSSYAYAGTEEVPDEDTIYKVDSIAWDSSHSHRMPIWLISIRDAFDDNERKNYYNHLIKGLGKQLSDVVLKEINIDDNNIHVTTNYLDGNNGYYRWDKITKTGYAPFGLSGTITLGWWALVDNQSVSSMYKSLKQQFPLNSDILEFYLEPRVSRERHFLFDDYNSYNNGFRELDVIIASQM